MVTERLFSSPSKLLGAKMMSILPLLIVGFVSVPLLCTLHSACHVRMPRARFVVLALFGGGLGFMIYPLMWVVGVACGQAAPGMNLMPLVGVGGTLWAVMVLYGITHAIVAA